MVWVLLYIKMVGLWKDNSYKQRVLVRGNRPENYLCSVTLERQPYQARN